ncbi:hypothetical protein DdX_19540 [Ditylenchus destructor]|uniref:Uncharacterized protein n=1 Tax=Ditylenchus destructor TaxID=166010 RepID=A0AAD4MIU7_9BILA|nr:hypothetical protein DdX_19540 [Ditylenchus destructor]
MQRIVLWHMFPIMALTFSCSTSMKFLLLFRLLLAFFLLIESTAPILTSEFPYLLANRRTANQIFDCSGLQDGYWSASTTFCKVNSFAVCQNSTTFLFGCRIGYVINENFQCFPAESCISEYPLSSVALPNSSFTHIRLRQHPRRRSSLNELKEDEYNYGRQLVCAESGFLCGNMPNSVIAEDSNSTAYCGANARFVNLTIIHLTQDHIDPVRSWAESYRNMAPKRVSKFEDKYSTEFSGIKRSKKGDEYAFCTLCQDDISLVSIGKGAISIHQQRIKHQKASKAANTSKAITEFTQNKVTPSNTDRQAAAAEGTWAYHIHDWMMKILTKHCLDPTKITAFCADNAPSMFGSSKHGGEENLFFKLKQTLKTNILPIGCPAHVLHNSAKKAAENLAVDLEPYVFKLASHFRNSTKRIVEFEELCDKLDISFEKLNNHGQTRWTTLQPVLEKMLRLWDPLQEYFSKDGPLFLKKFFVSESSKAITMFLAHVLDIFNKAINRLQIAERKFKQFYGLRTEQYIEKLGKEKQPLLKHDFQVTLNTKKVDQMDVIHVAKQIMPDVDETIFDEVSTLNTILEQILDEEFEHGRKMEEDFQVRFAFAISAREQDFVRTRLAAQETGSNELFISQFRADTGNDMVYTAKVGHTEDCPLCLTSTGAMRKMIEATELLAVHVAVKLCENAAKNQDVAKEKAAKEKCDKLQTKLITPLFGLVKEVISDDVLCRMASKQCIAVEEQYIYDKHLLKGVLVHSCELCKKVLDKANMMLDLVIEGGSVMAAMVCSSAENVHCDPFWKVFMTTAELLLTSAKRDSKKECQKMGCYSPAPMPTYCYKAKMRGWALCESNAHMIYCAPDQGYLKTRQCKDTEGNLHVCATMNCLPKGGAYADAFDCSIPPPDAVLPNA